MTQISERLPRRHTQHRDQIDVTGVLLKGLRRVAGQLPLTRQAAIVRFVLPRRWWYSAALLLARLHGAITVRMGGNGPFTTAMMFDLWLRELSFGGAFPLRYRVTGGEIAAGKGPRLYVWTHLPLTEVPLHVVLAMGGDVPAVVSDPGKVVGEDRFLVFGSATRARAIPANAGAVRQVIATLRAGTPAVFLADPYLGGAVNDLPLRVAMRTGVPVIFQWAELAAGGVLEVVFQHAPRPVVRTEEDVAVNLRFLEERNREALLRLGWARG